MSTQFKLLKSMAASLIAATLLSACDGSVRREGPPKANFQVVRVDSARNRLWVLERDAVSVHDNTNGRRLRRIVLDEWIVVGEQYGCPPDMVLDSSGAAFVSSNVLPVLWRIDPQRYEVARIELALSPDTGQDVGFTGLSLAGDGTLVAAGAISGSIWHIDAVGASARKIASYRLAETSCDPAKLLRAGQEASSSVVASRP